MVDVITGIGFEIDKSTTDLTYLRTLAGISNDFSGNYNDLYNKPTLFSGSYLDLENKPTLFSGSYTDLENKPMLFSGSYTDLENKPTLFSGNYDDLTNVPSLSFSSLSGVPSDLLVKPTDRMFLGLRMTKEYDLGGRHTGNVPSIDISDRSNVQGLLFKSSSHSLGGIMSCNILFGLSRPVVKHRMFMMTIEGPFMKILSFYVGVSVNNIVNITAIQSQYSVDFASPSNPGSYQMGKMILLETGDDDTVYKKEVDNSGI